MFSIFIDVLNNSPTTGKVYNQHVQQPSHVNNEAVLHIVVQPKAMQLFARESTTLRLSDDLYSEAMQ